MLSGCAMAWVAWLKSRLGKTPAIRQVQTVAPGSQPIDSADEFNAFLQAFGGPVEAGVRDNQAPSAALQIGDQCVSRALGRLRAGKACVIRHDLTYHRSLNAAATRLTDGYGLMVSLLLVVTIQGFTAAIWASKGFAAHVGKLDGLLDKSIFNGDLPPGFESYGIFVQKGGETPAEMAQGVKREWLEAIRSAGDDRWECYVATWRAALEFVYNHELAHILYGHVDLMAEHFGLSAYLETDASQDVVMPRRLSQYLEHTADMDAALQVFGDLYGKVFEKQRNAILQDQNDAGCTILGTVIAIFVLEAERTFLGRSKDRGTHPPLSYRAAWVQSAEALALRELPKQFNVEVRSDVVTLMRKAMTSMLYDAAHLHEPIFSWLAYFEGENVEDEVYRYILNLRDGSAAYFGELDKVQMV
jgi:hypothetical protein